MASLHIACLIFLIFHMVRVETAPRTVRSDDKNNANRLVFDDRDYSNFESLNNAQNSLPQSPQTKKDDAILTTVDNSSKTISGAPYMDDVRLNWGVVVNDTILEDDDEASYSRPINIPKPTDGLLRPTETSIKDLQTNPLSENISRAIVNEKKKITVAFEDKQTVARPTSCDVAIVYCCMRNTNLEECFREKECLRQISPKNVCDANEMYKSLKKLSEYYNLSH